jgi:hypothetical protein
LTKTSSLRTQGASVAYTEQPTTKKVCHYHNLRARNKLNKQHSVLTVASVPQSVLTNLLSTHEIENKIIVFDGGVIDNSPIKPPNGVVWQSIPICVGKHVHICDEVDSNRGLTFQHVDNVLPFIRLPRAISLNLGCAFRWNSGGFWRNLAKRHRPERNVTGMRTGMCYNTILDIPVHSGWYLSTRFLQVENA